MIQCCDGKLGGPDAIAVSGAAVRSYCDSGRGNHPYSAIIGNSSAPFINKLANQGRCSRVRLRLRIRAAELSGVVFGIDAGGHHQCVSGEFCDPESGRGLDRGREDRLRGIRRICRRPGARCAPAGDMCGGTIRRPILRMCSGVSNRPMSDFPARIGKLPAVSFVFPILCTICTTGRRGRGSLAADHLGSYVRWAKRKIVC